ncbi:MAG: hypothetical protein AVDCRST_MAG65-2119, partial [uncultured Solirubrobacteraceae bacterium]
AVRRAPVDGRGAAADAGPRGRIARVLLGGRRRALTARLHGPAPPGAPVGMGARCPVLPARGVRSGAAGIPGHADREAARGVAGPSAVSERPHRLRADRRGLPGGTRPALAAGRRPAGRPASHRARPRPLPPAGRHRGRRSRRPGGLRDRERDLARPDRAEAAGLAPVL